MIEDLQELRKENKKTCAEVAQVLGVTKSAVQNYESGIRSINLNQVLLLADFYGVSAEEIIHAQLNSCLSVR